MRKKKPVVIDVTDYRVIGERSAEPIIKSRWRLLWFLAPIVTGVLVKYALLRGSP